MKASIIIATYMRAPSLRDTLACVTQQDLEPEEYEIVVVDNSLSPSTEVRKAAEAYSKQFRNLRYLHFAPNGATSARHFGVKAARGECLVFIDDDVLCEPGWLRQLLQPFSDARVGLVFGKTVLRYEVEPPAWAAAFSVFLSRLDLGEQSRQLVPYETGYSCNMAVRARVFGEVQGLNPCYFGDPRFLKYCGDGECGLARKVHDHGDRVWYSVEAWLHHRVVAQRLSPDYMLRRARTSGVESVYCYFRYEKPGLVRLGGHALMCLAKAAVRQVLALPHGPSSNPAVRGRAAACHHWHAFRQSVRLLASPELKAFVRRPDYMDWCPPGGTPPTAC